MPMIVVESRRFDMAKRLSGREALVRELLDFKVDVTKRGQAVFENGGEKLVHVSGRFGFVRANRLERGCGNP